MRPRNPENAWMPKGVYYRKRENRYVVIDGKEHYLADGSATKHEVWEAHRKWVNRGQDTVFALIEAYTTSAEFERLKPATQASYKRLLTQLGAWQMPRLRRPFGTLKLAEIGPKTIQSAYDQQEPNTARNRRWTVAKAMWSWGRFRFPSCEDNPVMGLRMPPEAPRDRYVDDWEVRAFYSAAPEPLQLIMDAVYLFVLRPSEAFSILSHQPVGVPLSKVRQSCVLDDGVLIFRGKGSWGNFYEWSKASKEWDRRCKARGGSVYQITLDNGNRVTKSSYDSMVRRTWAKLPHLDRFHIHDLKAKGKTDHPENESGHKSKKLGDAVYLRTHRRQRPTR